MNDKPNAYLHEHLGQRPTSDYVPPEKMRMRQFAISEKRIDNRVCMPAHRNTETKNGHAGAK